MYQGLPGVRPFPPGQRAPGAIPGMSAPGDEWRGVPSERRWAMEVLGLRSGMLVERDDVQKRFRRLVRLAHPDHGAGSAGAAERIAELADAREVLLGLVDSADARPAG